MYKAKIESSQRVQNSLLIINEEQIISLFFVISRWLLQFFNKQITDSTYFQYIDHFSAVGLVLDVYLDFRPFLECSARASFRDQNGNFVQKSTEI